MGGAIPTGLNTPVTIFTVRLIRDQRAPHMPMALGVPDGALAEGSGVVVAVSAGAVAGVQDEGVVGGSGGQWTFQLGRR